MIVRDQLGRYDGKVRIEENEVLRTCHNGLDCKGLPHIPTPDGRPRTKEFPLLETVVIAPTYC